MFDDKRKRYDVRLRPIGKLANPKGNDDAVTKKYLESFFPVKLNSGYDFKNYWLQDIGNQLDDSDGLNLKYVRVYFISKNAHHKLDS